MITPFKYTITGELYGSGGIVLYSGHRNADRAPVTLKVLAGERPSPKLLAALRHEHAILRELPLPSVLRAQDFEVWEQGAALVLEGFDGQTLQEVARARRLSPEEVVKLGAAIAGALEAVHAHGVIHKDVRPRNILVGRGTGEIKLIDFSVASRTSQEVQPAASPKLLEGTLAYMSPEQTGRMNRAIDPRTDLYGLGVTLYELLTGALPFPTTDPVELIHSHIARTPSPPRDEARGVPKVVSDIVIKLLAKAPEDRYQTAYGLKVDLEACLRTWGAEGGPPSFPLGQHDRSGELRIPQKLYGREQEIAALFAALDRAGRGGAELLLVSGYSGVGKTALVHEIQKALAQKRRGAFIAGKFDQLSRRVPYGPVMQPFRALSRQVLAESEESLARWKERLLSAVGPNGQVLIDMIPELARIIGPQPDVPELGPTESQNRFRLVFHGFVRAIAARRPPLVLFLDDLQWADETSLRLVQLLLTDPHRAHLLVVGAYRDGEVSASHPLSLFLGDLRSAGAAVSTIELKALTAPDVAALVRDAVGEGGDRAAPLGALVHEKTGGNPLFVSQFLQTLYARGLLAFDARAEAWTWDLKAIAETAVTDNVATFMERKIGELAPATRELLELAACIGDEFDLATLSAIARRAPGEATELLGEALREGLVVPVDAGERLPPQAEAEGAGAAPDDEVSYRFLHDRVQQAAYTSLDSARKQEIHARIGWLGRERYRRFRSDEALFHLVEHLNLGAALIDDLRERTDLAAMNLSAGRKAKARAAYPTAAGYLEAGISVLPEGSWERDHELAFALRAEAAECAYLSGRFDRAESLFDVMLSRARSRLETAHTRDLRIALYMTQGRIADALREGRIALALFGIEIPEDEPSRRAAADAEVATARAALAERTVKRLLDAPEVTDDATRAALELLMSMTMPASFASPSLYTLVVARQVNLSLERGHSSVSAYGYMAHGWIEARVFRRYKEAYELGMLALDLNERFDNPDLSCKLHFIFGAHISLFSQHLLSSVDHLAQAYQAGLRAGDFSYLSQTCVQTALVRMGLGDECRAVRDEVNGFLTLMQRTRDELATATLTAVRQVLDNLMGVTGRFTLSSEAFDEAAFEARFSAPGYATVALVYYALKQQLCFLYEDHDGALRMTRAAESRLEGGVGDHLATELYFYTCLLLLSPSMSRLDQPLALPLALYRERLATWAECCPDNYRHKHLLVRAEAARAAGEELAAMKLYDQAIEQARVNGFLRDEAIASELCAKFHVASGREKIAHLYMTEAYHAYLRWGATAKTEQLARRYPHLVAQAALALPLTGRLDTPPPATFMERPEILDTMAVLRAARTISSEILLDRLLDRLLHIVIETAGAQRGVLLLGRGDALTIEATITVDPDQIQVGPSTPLDADADLAVTVVQYVARTDEPVVLSDAAVDERFAVDPYVVERRARSILCVAMTHQGRLTGVLYLENNAAAGAFSAARVELCSLMASQAAVAIENALLYQQVQETSRELRRGKDALEAEVARRTEELREANEQLTLELASRQRTEEQRAALQEEIIRVQRDRLSELSAPLIPITDRITVMPLIGELDSARARQVLETTVQGAAERGAEVVIIDVTGAKRVEAAVATTLVETAAALRLLGARVVITGIHPQAARALVELGLDLRGIVTHGTLQSGLAYALQQLGGDARWIHRSG